MRYLSCCFGRMGALEAASSQCARKEIDVWHMKGLEGLDVGNLNYCFGNV